MNEIYTKAKQLLSFTFIDVNKSCSIWRYWSFRAWVRYRLRYQGSSLGLLWPVLSLCIVVFVLGTLWSKILARTDSTNYYLYLLAGFPVWQYIAASVREGVKGTSDSVSNSSLPFTCYIFEKLALNALPLIQLIPVVVIAALFFGSNGTSHLIYLPIAIFTLLAWSIGVIAILIVLSTIRPDVKHLVESFMRLAFLATPIVWEPSRLGAHIDLVWFNPFFVPLEFMRYSLTGIIYLEDVIWIAPIYSITIFIVGCVLFSRYIHKLRMRAAAQ